MRRPIWTNTFIMWLFFVAPMVRDYHDGKCETWEFVLGLLLALIGMRALVGLFVIGQSKS